jgi:predicted nucleic acid-binding protein
MPVLIDTQVFVYAICVPIVGEDEKLARLKLSAKQITAANADLVISSITMLEILRGLRGEALPDFNALMAKTRVEAITAATAERANELLRARGPNEVICEKCLGSVQMLPCSKCNRNISRAQKLNDALILATADTVPDITLLYSEDGGIHHMAAFARSKVERLPDPHGPLFAHEQRKREAAPAEAEPAPELEKRKPGKPPKPKKA